MTAALPAPLLPADVDLRGTPLPREAFALAGADFFGIDIEVARRFVNEAADRFEGAARPSRRRGGKPRGRL